ncbi:MAG: carbon-nitrogen hydrolase family protein [Lewinellaceae bacterium]|nr:carbon-nitrogen hydrolase family protein [Lewinellaceae bacterium]
MNTSNVARVAVVQAAPYLFDLDRSLQILEQNLAQAAAGGAQLVVFPESFLPGYPRGLTFGAVIGSRSEAGREEWLAYVNSSVEVPGPVTDRLASLAQQYQVWLAVGVTERTANHGTLYCSLLYFSPEGLLAGRHRKLKPTASERIVWGEGAGDDLHVHATPLGNLGGLICWENYMPLARYALYEQGIEIYLAPTADQRETWLATLQHIACEGRCYVLGCNQWVRPEHYPEAYLAALPDPVCRGGSVIVDPLGRIVAGPLWDEPGILFAEIDRNSLTKSRLDFDAIGHYQRPDVFGFTWKQSGE